MLGILLTEFHVSWYRKGRGLSKNKLNELNRIILNLFKLPWTSNNFCANAHACSKQERTKHWIQPRLCVDDSNDNRWNVEILILEWFFNRLLIPSDCNLNKSCQTLSKLSHSKKHFNGRTLIYDSQVVHHQGRAIGLETEMWLKKQISKITTCRLNGLVGSERQVYGWANLHQSTDHSPRLQFVWSNGCDVDRLDTLTSRQRQNVKTKFIRLTGFRILFIVVLNSK